MPRAAPRPGRVVAVAYSGGRDSTALLHATVLGTEGLGIDVVALHVHHGLSPNADAWQAHCVDACRRYGVSLFTERLRTAPAAGESVEAWARGARYKALHRLAAQAGAATVLLAHHQRDQAETWLLQALRGGGTRGLAAMPNSVQRKGVTWLRPWLETPSQQVADYIAHHGLRHIEDESNADTSLARNRLRGKVWPALVAAFPQAEAVLAKAAGWAQEADACLAELAALDLAQLDAASPEGAAAFPIDAWVRWSAPRRSNVLRAWLHRATGLAAPAALAQRLLRELPAVGSASWPLPGGRLRRHLRVLRWQPAVAKAAVGVVVERQAALSICRAGRYRLRGWGGTLQVERVAVGGVPLAWLANAELRPRNGGERFQAGIGRPPRSLKKQFQSAGVDLARRAAPLLFSGGQLVFVPGLGIDARVIGLPGQPQVQLRWCPDDVASSAG